MITERSALDLDTGIGQRSTTCVFTVIDGSTGAYRGEVHPSRGSSPSISHDTTSTIPRRLQGLTLLPDEANLFRPLVDRIVPTLVIDGIGEYQLGRYVAADDVQTIRTDGVSGALTAAVRPLSLFDEMFIVDQGLPDSFASGGVLISEVIKTLLDGLPIDEPRIEGCSETSDAGWSAGTSRASALKDLCSAGGYLAPWFDHQGVLRCVQAFDPNTLVPTFDISQRMIRDSITLTDESVSMPNRYIVVSNDTGESTEPVVGIYDVPVTAPHSILNRGFVVPDIRDVQVETSEQAQVYARTVGLQETIVEKLECDTPVDPRHDGYDIVRAFGQNWLEIGWSMSLTSSGTMRHVLSRTYPTSGE